MAKITATSQEESPRRSTTETRRGRELQPSDMRQATVSAAQGLNLREGPGSDFSVLTVLPDGADLTVCPVCVYGVQGVYHLHIPGWSYVFTDQIAGWVMDAFLSVSPDRGPV